jgi:hypothetical protein
MKKRFIWSVFASVSLLTGCVNLSSSPPLPEDHPASPNAGVSASEAAKPFLMSATNLAALRLEDLPKAADASAHDHSGHATHDAHAVPAKDTPTPQGAIYTCPHHPEVKQNKPGECPKCKMKLEVKK